MDTPSITSHFAEVIQTSLAPVFLTAGTAGFVNIYVGRLAKLSDRLNDIVEKRRRTSRYRYSSPTFAVAYSLWRSQRSSASVPASVLVLQSSIFWLERSPLAFVRKIYSGSLVVR